MSALRKAGVWLGLIEDEGDALEEREFAPPARRERPRRDAARRYTEDDYGEEDEEFAEPSESTRSRPTERVAVRRPEQSGRPDRRERLENRHDNVRSITRESPTREATVSHLTRDNLALAPQPVAEPVAEPEPERRYQITTLHPTTYREARTIGEHFREGTPVIMNLTEMDEADARRLVDFGAGLAFGLRGTMERVTNRVFLLSPANVQVTAEDKAKIAEGEFFRNR
jgi:cell division inhibitor SepF